MQLTGHKTRSVFDRSDVTSGDDLRAAVGKVSAFTGTLSGTAGRMRPARPSSGARNCLI
jgi:hypothetical protein